LNTNVYAYLKAYSTSTVEIDRLITSAFLYSNGLEHIENINLSKYVISDKDSNEFVSLLTFLSLIDDDSEHSPISIEDLIELFEFVVSPADKVVNGAVFTPKYIREFIVEKILGNFSDLQSCTFADLSCGCGGFLLTLSNHIHAKTKETYFNIYKNNLFGNDIASYSIERTKIILTINALMNGDESKEFVFNLLVLNALNGQIKNGFLKIQADGGFDAVVGNPPYVCSRNIDEESKKLLKNWSVTVTGHPDLYIPFFQIGLDSLKPNGMLGYITVNSFFKSVNGRALRTYFSASKFPITIINFAGEQIFRARNTYTCLCFIQNKHEGKIKYALTGSEKLKLHSQSFFDHEYSDLANEDGWNLVSSRQADELVKKVERTGKPFTVKYVTRNGIATLRNDVYKFSPLSCDRVYYHFKSNNNIYKVEKAICRDIINSNKVKSEEDILSQMEKIIFPYTNVAGRISIIPERTLKNRFPYAYSYLKEFATVLLERDKGEGSYEEWYAFGRRQSLDIKSYKLFFPHLCDRPTFVLCKDKHLLFYNGIAVISNNLDELKMLKKICESDIFFQYIKHTTKNYASGYVSLSKNYIKNFGIPDFSKSERIEFLKLSDLQAVNSFLCDAYQLDVKTT
jgi:adenine-specific DNA-methyltransferase